MSQVSSHPLDAKTRFDDAAVTRFCAQQVHPRTGAGAGLPLASAPMTPEVRGLRERAHWWTLGALRQSATSGSEAAGSLHVLEVRGR